MSEARRYIYGLKLRDGRYLHAEGIDWQDAAKHARVKPSQVKRHMPVGIVLTATEREAQAQRLRALQEQKRKQEGYE
jgi:hypothetical protein